MPTALPFKRGTSMSAPGLAGEEFWDNDHKQWVKIVRNTDSAVLTAKYVVRWEDSSAFDVDLTTAQADGPHVAGVVDPLLGATVAVNKNCYIVIAGVVTVASSIAATAMLAGSLLVCDGTTAGLATFLTSVYATGTLTGELQQLTDQFGIQEAAGSAPNARDNIEVRLTLRR